MSFDEITREIKVNAEIKQQFRVKLLALAAFLLTAGSSAVYLCAVRGGGKIHVKPVPQVTKKKDKSSLIYDAVFDQYLRKNDLINARRALLKASPGYRQKYDEKFRKASPFLNILNKKTKSRCPEALARINAFYNLQKIFPGIKIERITTKLEKIFLEIPGYCKDRTTRLKAAEILLSLAPGSRVARTFYATSKKNGIQLFLKGYTILEKEPILGKNYIEKSLSFFLPCDRYYMIAKKILRSKFKPSTR